MLGSGDSPFDGMLHMLQGCCIVAHFFGHASGKTFLGPLMHCDKPGLVASHAPGSPLQDACPKKFAILFQAYTGCQSAEVQHPLGIRAYMPVAACSKPNALLPDEQLGLISQVGGLL